MRYAMTNDTIEFEGHTLSRIIATEDSALQHVHAGDLGGWIEKAYNLSQDGQCWVADDAKVFGEAAVRNAARVTNEAIVKDDAWVGGRSIVGGRTTLAGKSLVSGSAVVFKGTTITDETLIGDYHSSLTDCW